MTEIHVESEKKSRVKSERDRIRDLCLITRKKSEKILDLGSERVKDRDLDKNCTVRKRALISSPFYYSSEWRLAFEPRDLIGLSAEPLLVYPTHYTGEPGYITDTEDSAIIGTPEQITPQEPEQEQPTAAAGPSATSTTGQLGDRGEL